MSNVQPSSRSEIASFKVMDIMHHAQTLEAQGIHICHMEVGQPATSAPSKVIQRAAEVLQTDRIGYTSALGIAPLKAKIAEFYQRRHNVEVSILYFK